MNKRQFNKIIQLHKEGVSDEVCVAMIMDLCASGRNKLFLAEASSWVIEFFEAKEPDVTIYCKSCGANPLAETVTDFSVHDVTGPENVTP